MYCCCSVVQSCPTLCDPTDCSMPSFSVLHSLPEFVKTRVHWVDAIQPSHPLSPPSPADLNLTASGSFSSELALCIRWPKYCSFNFSISPSNEYSGLISFRMDWFDLLAVQMMLKSLQYQLESISSVDFSLLYGRILTSIRNYWKNRSFDYMDLYQQSYVFVFHMLSRFVIVFLPRIDIF